MLRALDQIKQQHGDAAEQQHGDGVFGPAHFVLFIDAGHAIEQALDRPEQRDREKCARR